MSEEARNIFGSDTGFKILFEYATIGIVVIDKIGTIKLANPFAEKLFGYKKGELKGQELEVLVPDEFRKMHTNHREGYFQNPKKQAMSLSNELYAKRKDGTLFSIEISLGHCELQEEKYAVTYITDISLRKKNEEALKKSEEKYHFIFDNA